MRDHRVSYIKTTVASLVISATALILAVHLLVTGQTGIRILDEILTTFSIGYWPSIGALGSFAVLWLMVGLGGLLSLQKDARESGGSSVRASQELR
jgi:hypothetical protein